MSPVGSDRKWSLLYIRDVIQVLVARDFKIRYKRSILGVGWSLLVPLAQLAVMYLVFSKMLRLNIPNFTSFLLAGILPWTWFQSSLITSSMTILDNRELVKQVGFPVGVLPSVTILSQWVHFVLALPILAIFLVADGFRPTVTVIALPVVMLVQFLLTASLAYIVATLQVTFRDTQYLLGISLFLFFYLTPVFWDASAMPEKFRWIFEINPLGMLLNDYRGILMRSQWPPVQQLTLLAAGSGVLLAFGYHLFLRARDRFVEEL
jgi:lipopolysaccharide transport system permease protein